MRWGAQFADDHLGISGAPVLRHYSPTPIWDGSGDLVVIETGLFETDEQLERVIEQFFSTIDIEAAGMVPVVPSAGNEQARHIIHQIAQAAPLFGCQV